MPIKGNAFVAIWHDIRSESEPEYNRWHTREHMPERLSIPGFARGRRGVDWNRERHRYWTLYEGPDLDVFGSPAYLQRLNNPTPWTQRIQPAFYNFIRCGCEVLVSLGEGVGGAMATYRVSFSGIDEGGLRRAARLIAEDIMVLGGVSSVHIGLARPESTGAKTKETELRGTTQDGLFDAAVLVDGIGRSELEVALPAISGTLAKHALRPAPEDVAIYDLAFALDSLASTL
jgi:hypothetical protein